MPAPMPDPGSGSDGELPPGGAAGPEAGPEPGSLSAAGLPEGLDYQALLEALAASGALDTDPDNQEAEIAEREAAEAEGRMLACDPAVIAAGVVEFMDPGPAQAGWLGVAAAAAGRLDEGALAGVAVAARRLGSWAQACELGSVAQITARAAAADRRIGVESDGRPVRLCRDAIGQVQLALMLTGYGAADWASLGITLAWRLRATGAALAAGRIDLGRAEVIAAATSVLDQDAARAVEAKILPGAGTVTKAYVQERARRAVIAADPEGAERRREAAERQAKVSLYGDEDQTATLAGSRLPAVHAAAAMARITAIARAMQAAAGVRGGLDRYRAQVMLALLLGTLPPIPPAQGAPPDPGEPPPGDDCDPGPGPAADGGPGPADQDGPGQDGPGQDGPGQPGPGQPGPGSGPADSAGRGPANPGGRGPGGSGPGLVDPGGRGPGGSGPGLVDPGGRGPADPGPYDDLPAPRDEDAPPDDGFDGDGAGDGAGAFWDPAEEDDDPYGTGPAPHWPELGVIPPALARRPARPARPGGDRRERGARPGGHGRPVPGLLDVLLPWTTLAGLAERPGTLGRIGPVTAAQARLLAAAAQGDPAAQWRVIVTNPAGQALAVTRIPRRTRRRPARDRPGGTRDGPGGTRDRPARDGPAAPAAHATARPRAATARRRGPGWSAGSP